MQSKMQFIWYFCKQCRPWSSVEFAFILHFADERYVNLFTEVVSFLKENEHLDILTYLGLSVGDAT